MSAALMAAKSDASTFKTTWSGPASALILVRGISFPASGEIDARIVLAWLVRTFRVARSIRSSSLYDLLDVRAFFVEDLGAAILALHADRVNVRSDGPLAVPALIRAVRLR